MTGFYLDKAKNPQEAADRIRKSIRLTATFAILVLIAAGIGLVLHTFLGLPMEDIQLMLGAGGFGVAVMALMITAYSHACTLDFMTCKTSECTNDKVRVKQEVTITDAVKTTPKVTSQVTTEPQDNKQPKNE